MTRRKFDPTERLGMNAVADIVTKDLEWIWREQPVADFGIDGQIEAVDRDNKPTGQLFAVQVKAGVSYFRGSLENIRFYTDDDHLKYWDQHMLPVILLLHDPNNNQTLWQWADLKTARPTARGWCIAVPRTKVFNAASKAELQGQVWQDDNVGLRRRFASDRLFMKTFKGRAAFVAIDIWVNKSLSFREIEVRFDDPDKHSVDYTIPIRATWDYEIRDVMQHFLPWLDYEHYEEPELIAEEMERHVMAVSLSKPATAFLELENFFNSWPPKKVMPKHDL
jgi:hypothetical protein